MQGKPPTIDPNLTTLQSQAEQGQIDALQELARADGASLMARYGTRLALSGAAGSTSMTASPLTGSVALTGIR